MMIDEVICFRRLEHRLEEGKKDSSSQFKRTTLANDLWHLEIKFSIKNNEFKTKHTVAN